MRSQQQLSVSPPSPYEAEFEPLQAFLLKNTTVYAYPRQRRRPRNREEDADSMKAICLRLLYFFTFYTILALFFVGYLNWYMYFQVCILACRSGIYHFIHPTVYSCVYHLVFSYLLTISLVYSPTHLFNYTSHMCDTCASKI